MKLNKTQLDQVEANARLQFRPAQIAVIIGVDVDDFCDAVEEPKSAPFLRYNRGQLLAEAEVRKSLLEMAKQGSSPAQKQLMAIIAANNHTDE